MSHSISLSRPGRCAGRVPLSLLVYKLIRSGEEAAARALQSFPKCRVRWTLPVHQPEYQQSRRAVRDRPQNRL